MNMHMTDMRQTEYSTTNLIGRGGPTLENARALFRAGLANQAGPASFPDNHPLGLIDSSLYFNQDSGYVFQYIELFRDTIAADTVPATLRIGTTPYLREVRLPVSFTKARGYHIQVNMQADYSYWFQNIDARQDSPMALIDKIVANQAQGFSILDIELKDK